MKTVTKTALISVLILTLNSCAVKEEQNSDDIELKKVTYSSKYQTSPDLEQKKIVACVGDQCRATIFTNSNGHKNIEFSKKVKTKKEFFIKENKTIVEPIESTPLTYTYQEYQKNIKIRKIDKKVAIQVGAFRRYAGARVYAKRYGLLSRKYKTVIKKGYKDSKPIYRVRILGFRNKQEAREFMYRYNLNDAFLVRR